MVWRRLLPIGLLLVGRAAHAAPPSPTVPECLEASEKGQELRDDGRFSQAAERFALCSSPGCPAPVRMSCIKWQEALLESKPSIIVVARDDKDEDVLGAWLTVDGVLRTQLSGRAVLLDPGPHMLTATAAGYDTAEQRIIVNVNEKNRLVRVLLARASSSSTSAPALATHAAPNERPSTIRVPLAIGLGAAAVVGLASSFVVGLGARSDLARLQDSSCASNRTCDEGTTDRLRTRFIVADVLLGAGVVTAAAALWVWFATP